MLCAGSADAQAHQAEEGILYDLQGLLQFPKLPSSPDLTIAACCVQALEMRKQAKLKRVYYDLEDMIKTNKDGQTPYTPVLPLLYGMQASMQLMKDEGFENVIKRHHR